jgi:hypothetical protein
MAYGIVHRFKGGTKDRRGTRRPVEATPSQLAGSIF